MSIFSDPLSPSDESVIDCLIDSELHHLPRPDFLVLFRRSSVDLTARQDSINWILKVHEHYEFSPVTVILSVNYLDRFLSTLSLPKAKRWPIQLLSVACLSLAAKMEEPYVPLLVDLQTLEPEFVFGPKTVQRMELWVMANLDWRLRAVTPFDYLDFFASRVSFSGSRPDFVVHCSDLILKTTRVVDFVDYPPSVIAAAAVTSAAGESFDLPRRVNKEMVRSCHQLMEKYLLDTCHSAAPKVKPDAPESPAGVLDVAACGSCGARSDNPLSGSGSEYGPGMNESEPPTKRQRSSASDVQEEHQ